MSNPPHHPHNRQVPAANSAWNHLQVPNYFPRQPQHAHMSNEHPILHQPTWHTPTVTEPLKNPIQHSHLFNLEQMLSDRPFPRHSPGVDLSVTRNGSQNGDATTSPISLSVRDTKKINSLAASALDIQAAELKATSPGLKSISPSLRPDTLKALTDGFKPRDIYKSDAFKSVSEGLKSLSPGMNSLSPTLSISPALSINATLSNLGSFEKSSKKAKRVDLILERLNPEKMLVEEKLAELERPSHGVIVQASSSHDENSNASSILNVPTPTNIREDDVVSPYSNEDSLDSNKSRRKRKPAKTSRVTKDSDIDLSKSEVPNLAEEAVDPLLLDTLKDSKAEVAETNKVPERRKSPSPEMEKRKNRRKTSSESETIDKIAAMVQETAKTKADKVITTEEIIEKQLDVPLTYPVVTLAQKKDFVAVEDKLEQMFAGLEEEIAPPISSPKPISTPIIEAKPEEITSPEVLSTPSTSHDNVTSTSNDLSTGNKKRLQKKRKPVSRRSSEELSTPKKKKAAKKNKFEPKLVVSPKKIIAAATATTSAVVIAKKVNGKVKTETPPVKDVYAYDSGSNASSNKSRGPFVHIRGPRDSPLSVCVINTPTNDEDPEKKVNKTKKFHDDTEYRHKVRSRGLHCSTLSNKYDAQTKDATWICVFCKRGPYSGDFSSIDGFYTPGDLFGPYVITNKCAEFDVRLDDPYDKQFRSKKVCRTLEASAKTKRQSAKGRKHSESVSDTFSDSNVGITDMQDGKSFEIWAHEDCIVWSPGIYLIGPKIVGLEESVWTSSNVNCSRCTQKGANICCLLRGCPSVVHLGCAVISDWQLDDDNYKAFCVEHKQ